MPNILVFPNELLHRIINDVPRFDLLSLALCNKFFYALTERPLKQHLALHERYSTLTFGVDNDDDDFEDHPCDDTRNALLFLGHMIEDPEIAYYRTVVLKGQDSPSDPKSDEEPYKCGQTVVERYSDRLKTLVDECEFFPAEEKEDILSKILDPRRENAACALLLALLPNLKSLKMQDQSLEEGMEPIEDLVQRVAWSNINVMPTRHGKALSQLRELSIRSTDDEGGDRESMECFGTFAMLPSIRAIRGHMIEAEVFEWHEAFLPRSSSVTEISIDCSVISSDAFEALFSGTPTLTKFKYQYAGVVSDAVYDPAGTVQALRKYAASTLQSLDLETTENYRWCLSDDQLVGSLRMFASLRSLRIDNLAFTLPIPKIDNTVKTLEDMDPVIRDEGKWMERLIDSLPPSIEGLTLILKADDKEMAKLLRYMAKLKTERLPRLKSIEFESPSTFTPSIKTTLKESGLEDHGIILNWKVTI